MATDTENKSVHTIILDAAPILLNTPPISTLTSTCNTIITTPAVVGEIRGEEARRRFETLYRPFVELRNPKPESVKHVRDFARRTGDLAVLSATDVELLALAYDLECERNGGDWRLRNVPGQKRVNGSPPEKKEQKAETEATTGIEGMSNEEGTETIIQNPNTTVEVTNQLEETTIESAESVDDPMADQAIESNIDESTEESTTDVAELQEDESADSDEGWITPSNIKRKQAKDENGTDSSKQEQKTLQVATMTGDFAMQNVLLKMNLNLLSTKTCKRIAHIKQTIFRCHACFQTTKDMSKQFCPRCGKPTLTRVSCTTNDKGEVKLHLKSNFQWNNRGNVYSVPKPAAGTANQKWKGSKTGGGQGGWGNNLILAEDQKEYTRAMSSQKRTKQKDLMDEDALPSILTGDRTRGGRIQVGAGRAINSRKR